MLADLHTALTAPFELIDTLYQRRQDELRSSSSSSQRDSASTSRLPRSTLALSAFDKLVQERFANLLEAEKNLDQLPLITSTTTPSTLPALGSLVRFRAMVQDTGYGSELYRATRSTSNGQEMVVMFGRDEVQVNTHQSGGVVHEEEDYTNLQERQSFYIVSVPGENEWVKLASDKQPLQNSVASLSLQEGSAETGSGLPNKYPIPSERHFGCIAKIYGEAADKIKTTDVYDFVGILGETQLTDSFDELAAQSGAAVAPSAPIPALHVILTLPVTYPIAPVDKATDYLTLRKELVDHLTTLLQGDSDAAEWLLLALLARIHLRHPTGLALGSLSLNLAYPLGTIAPDTSEHLIQFISSLVPRSTHLSITIPILNSSSTPLAPRTIEESLHAGALQLASNTLVLVDTLSIGQGQLVDTGVKNLRHLATTIAQQKLTYEFPYASFDLETDLGFVVLSQGKAIIPTDCVVYVQPQTTTSTLKVPEISHVKLSEWRSFLHTFKHDPFSVPESMSETIQADFVDRRSKSVGGQGMTQDDLVFRMTASRLMALSFGREELGVESWVRTGELDDRRKERGPQTVRGGTA
ncbi:BZ3500_MvSof-1268-A1-R1_Chr4-3g07350 [Microbotryum saponariae]|uniref:BZ3500_MvSof-1268-A1-R1_Chr4-3g07350 protein n=1 Tax=Microbotryum saponariae TaxID=289078 RepID=A0A2X0M4R2_9BASI|nr:BZ3500_MvSof-1268-A1-R1_Chr4-3g07350 [Microbotryum saponariae]SDA07013.1 BZ3501_MvSof-1269-A2-R1_Chr4-2g07059 [Microbotryum saponariae]